MITVELEIECECEDKGKAVLAYITVTAEVSFGAPAITSGPPDNWAPADGEDVDIISVEAVDEDGEGIPVPPTFDVSDLALNILEAAYTQSESEYEEAAEHAAEAHAEMMWEARHDY